MTTACMDTVHAHPCLLTFTLIHGYSWSAKANKSALHALGNEARQIISIKLITTVGHFLHDLDFAANIDMA